MKEGVSAILALALLVHCTKAEDRALTPEECVQLDEYSTSVLVAKSTSDVADPVLKKEMEAAIRRELTNAKPVFPPNCGDTVKKRHLDCALKADSREAIEKCVK